MSKKNNGNDSAKSQSHLKSKNEREVVVDRNAPWNNPSERIYIPCGHFITVKKANEQAMESCCVSISCTVCKKEFPIEVLEEQSNCVSANNQYADSKRYGNKNYGNNKIYPERPVNQQMARGSNESSINQKPYKASNKNGNTYISSSLKENMHGQGKWNPQLTVRESKGQSSHQNSYKATNLNGQGNITKSNNENARYQDDYHKRISQQNPGVPNWHTNYLKPNKKSDIGSNTNHQKEFTNCTKYVNSELNINKQVSHKPVQSNNSKNGSSDLKNLLTDPGETIVSPQMSYGHEKNIYIESHKNDHIKNESPLKLVSASSMGYNKDNGSVNDSSGSLRSEMTTTINGYSKGTINIPVPAPRRVKVDGTALNNSSNSLIANPTSDIMKLDSAQEKGAIKKQNRSDMPITNSISGGMKLASVREKGAIKKNYSLGASFLTCNSPLNEQQLQICITCTKVITQKSDETHLSKGHEVMNMKEGVDYIRNRELKVMKSLQNDIQKELHEIGKHDTTLTSSINILPEIYKTFNDWPFQSGSQNDKGKKILYQIQELSDKNFLMDKPFSYMDSENLRHTVNKTKIEVENWFKETNDKIPFWLISSWLKNSVAIMVAGAVIAGKEVFVVKGNQGDEIARLLLLGNRLFLSPFLKNVTTNDDDYFIKEEYVKPLFNQESSLAFMRISYGNEELSEPIIIRVNTETFCGRQFLLMCTSESGQSFLGTKFFRNNCIGKEGHHIWGGDYSNNDGSGGNVVLPYKDISFEKSPLPLVTGMVASRFGFEDRSTIFRVFLQVSRSEFMESCAFAQIEEGIDILKCAALKGDISQLVISDVGLVVELN